jgi:hypothetical protein
MLALLIFILVAYGASNIMVFGTIFSKFRIIVGVESEKPNFFGKLFGCMMCLPFWWGILLSLFMYSPTLMTGLMEDVDVFELFTINSQVLATFFDGCLASGSVWLIHTLQEKLES